MIDSDSYEILNKEAEKIPAGSEGLIMLPHLSGAMAPEANPKAKGVFYGFTLHHSKAHFIRAIMEAIACIVRRNIDALEKLNIEVKEIRSLGGGSRSKLWNQIKADLTQKPVLTMENEEAASLGAAITAGVAVEMFKNIEEACNKMVVVKERFEPQKDNLVIYENVYSNYVKLYEDLCDLFSRT
jgi:xylulokinase